MFTRKIKSSLRSWLLSLVCLLTLSISAKGIDIQSPNGNVKLTVNVENNQIGYSVFYHSKTIFQQKNLTLTLASATLGKNPEVEKIQKQTNHGIIHPIMPLKQATVSNDYNQATINFRGRYSLQFRVTDSGVAYRWITKIKGKVEVMDESFNLTPQGEWTVHLQQNDNFKTAYENYYTHFENGQWKPTDKMSNLPVLLSANDGNDTQILISETNLRDYPCMFVKGNGQGGMTATFPQNPLKWEDSGDRSVKFIETANYIALTNGTRTFPWRYMVIGTSKTIPEQTLNLQLQEKSLLTDTEWIKPGKVSWEWWNGFVPYGPNVNFKAGYNTDSYKYYIDFAASYGIDYILMDEGWAKETSNPFEPTKEINLPELISYGKSKGVGIILWLPWLTVEKHFDLFKYYSQLGIKGVKIDFMDRSDQWMVNWYERVAKTAAENKLFVDMHGSFKPAGLEALYPNLMTYEGVRGMEQMGGCKPDNSLYFPFMRNAVGAMDYTPGAMISMQPESYHADRPNAASIGTRAYQMALYIVFESRLQMLADSPVQYYKNDECTKFIASVPVIWDETRVLDAKVGEYIVEAKRKGDKWYIGAICNGKEHQRNLDVVLDFLNPAQKYVMTSFIDGINADVQAMDYRCNQQDVNKGQVIKISMTKNGGFAAIIE